MNPRVRLFTLPPMLVDDYEVVVGEFCQANGLRRDLCVGSALGLLPLPVPQRDRFREYARTVGKAVLTHPVLWLDREVAYPYDGEIDPLWMIRVWLELTNAGCVDPESGDVADALLAAGLDIDDPVDEHRVRMFLAGGNDVLLEGFVIPAGPPPAGRDDDWAFVEAELLYEEMIQEWTGFAQAEQEAKQVRLAEMIELFESVRFEDVVAEFVTAAETHRQTALVRHPVPQQVVSAFWAGVNVMSDRLNDLHRLVADMQFELSGQDTSLDVEAAKQRRAAMFGDLIGSALAHPADEQRLAAIIRAVRSEFQSLDVLKARVLGEEPAVLPGQVKLAPPPTWR